MKTMFGNIPKHLVDKARAENDALLVAEVPALRAENARLRAALTSARHWCNNNVTRSKKPLGPVLESIDAALRNDEQNAAADGR